MRWWSRTDASLGSLRVASSNRGTSGSTIQSGIWTAHGPAVVSGSPSVRNSWTRVSVNPASARASLNSCNTSSSLRPGTRPSVVRPNAGSRTAAVGRDGAAETRSSSNRRTRARVTTRVAEKLRPGSHPQRWGRAPRRLRAGGPNPGHVRDTFAAGRTGLGTTKAPHIARLSHMAEKGVEPLTPIMIFLLAAKHSHQERNATTPALSEVTSGAQGNTQLMQSRQPPTSWPICTTSARWTPGRNRMGDLLCAFGLGALALARLERGRRRRAASGCVQPFAIPSCTLPTSSAKPARSSNRMGPPGLEPGSDGL
jgi:hypothetical protein